MQLTVYVGFNSLIGSGGAKSDWLDLSWNRTPSCENTNGQHWGENEMLQGPRGNKTFNNLKLVFKSNQT